MESRIVEKIFENHRNFYNENLCVETIKQQAAQLRQVSDAYQGRVIFELLQNAIDKADKEVLVSISYIDDVPHLVVANDGTNFTYNSEYDYALGGSTRSDFQSICSVATSTKDAAKYIGNKGVGFKSVFSISKYATIYSRARILPQDEVTDIDFRIFNQFDTEEELAESNLNDNDIKAKLRAVKQENASWAIPGYYFPIQVFDRPDFIKDLFNQDKGFVTIVSVPIAEDKLDAVIKKLDEIRRFHFHFISDKHHDSNIKITFEGPDVNPFVKSTERNPRIISQPVSKETRALAKKIGLNISEDATISLYFREQNEPGGMLYNFMPTERKSPISHVDINADFQTSVDRKNIVFSSDEDENIGKYNYALLLECLDLYKKALISNDTLSPDIFIPGHLAIESEQNATTTQALRDVFSDGFDTYAPKILGIRPLGNIKGNYDIYYRDFLLRLIRLFHPGGCNWWYYSNIVEICGQNIRKSGYQFLPDIEEGSQDKVFLSNSDNNIKLPIQIKAKISNYIFSLGDYNYGLNGFEYIKKGLGLSDFNQSDEIFILYRQCRNDGYYILDKQVSEEEQISILVSVCELMQKEQNREYYDCSTWRFIPILKSRFENSEMSQKGRAGTALASLFFKTINGKYKPAQLLCKQDIDPVFLEQIISQVNNPEFNIDQLLKKVGVSLSKKYIYADQRLVESIGDGLDFIPAILTEENQRNTYVDSISNIRVYVGNKSYHPTCINENYPTLFANLRLNDDLRALQVGRYDRMPKEYVDCLKKHLSRKMSSLTTESTEIYRFYQRNFENLYNSNLFIVKENKQFKVVEKDSEFIIVSNRWLLEEGTAPQPILCYTTEKDKLPLDLRNKFQDVIIHYDDSQSDEPSNEDRLGLNELLKDSDTIAKLLCQISNSRLSESTFDDSSNSLNIIRHRIEEIKIEERDNITTTYSINNEPLCYIESPYFYDKENNKLYIEVKDGEPERSRNIAARALATVIFHNEDLKFLIESTLFYNSYVDPNHVSEMKNRLDSVNYEISEENDTPTDKPDESTLGKEDNTVNWENIPDYEVIDFTAGSHSEVSEEEDKNEQNGCGTFVKVDQHITDQMVKTGKLGEMIVVKQIALKFIAEFKEIGERANAIESINAFLQSNGFEPIPLKEDQRYDTSEDIISLLWYTNHPRYNASPFDIVTIQNGDIRIIEVKSTEGKNSFRLSCRETKIADKYKDNYCVYRVSNVDHTIRKMGNPLNSISIMSNNDSITLIPAGFFVQLNKI